MTLEDARKYFNGDKYATETTGITIDEVGENYSKCSFLPDERHKAANGHVMGGAIFTLADFSFAVASNTPERLTYTVTSSINYVGQPKGRKLIAECKCLKAGRNTSVFEITVTDELENLVAVVNSTGMSKSLKKDS